MGRLNRRGITERYEKREEEWQVQGKELVRILEEQSPVEFACDWDNVGLLAGNLDKEIRKVYIALDATDEVVEEAVQAEADLLLTHHPLIFKGIKRITADDFIGRRLIGLIKNDIAYYAMHTNFDVKGMADLSAAMLGLEEPEVLDVVKVCDGREEGIGRVGALMEPLALKRCADFVKAMFSLSHVKVFGDPERVIRRAAVSPGSGRSEIGNAIAHGADVLITGDIDHHDGIDAVAKGLCIIDAGHYGLEHIFIRYMKEYLEIRCRDLELVTQNITFPYWIG